MSRHRMKAVGPVGRWALCPVQCYETRSLTGGNFWIHSPGMLDMSRPWIFSVFFPVVRPVLKRISISQIQVFTYFFTVLDLQTC